MLTLTSPCFPPYQKELKPLWSDSSQIDNGELTLCLHFRCLKLEIKLLHNRLQRAACGPWLLQWTLHVCFVTFILHLLFDQSCPFYFIYDFSPILTKCHGPCGSFLFCNSCLGSRTQRIQTIITSKPCLSFVCVGGGYVYICMIYKFKCSAHMCNMCGDQRPYLVSSLTALYLVFFFFF